MFRRLSNIIKGILSLFVSGLEKANPEALIELERQNLREQIANYNQGLAAQAGVVESLKSQISDNERQQRELSAKIEANLRASNNDLAANYALTLQGIEQQLITNKQQLEGADKAYRTALKGRDVAFAAARQKIEDLSRRVKTTKANEALAEMNEMAAGMISKIGASGDNLDRLDEQLKERENKAKGRVRLAQDSLKSDDIDMKEAEQKALANQALAQFASARGIALPASAQPQPLATMATKEIGPAATTPITATTN